MQAKKGRFRTVVVLAAVLIAAAIAIIYLYNLYLPTFTTSTSYIGCIATPGFECAGDGMSGFTQSGYFYTNFRQGLANTVYNVSLTCIAVEIPSSASVVSSWPWVPIGTIGGFANDSMPSDRAFNVSLPCYDPSGSRLSSDYNGTIPLHTNLDPLLWMRYSNIPNGPITYVRAEYPSLLVSANVPASTTTSTATTTTSTTASTTSTTVSSTTTI